jgi:lipooligosaccharide transport system ATP-binding protein
MAIIITRNLTKKFKELVAVDKVSLEINEAECFGLLGPNGAGKTTLIRMITAISPPTDGEVWVLGKELKSNARQVKASIGVVPQVDNLDPDLTVMQNLMTFARYFNIPKKEANQSSKEILNLFQLTEKKDSRIDALSGGMKRRLLIARGLINQPKIIIFDEPSIGLDPQAKYLVWRKIADLKAQGITQVLCTQNMEEAGILCDRVAVMHKGHILTIDAPQSLISKYMGDGVLEIQVRMAERDNIVNILKNNDAIFEEVADRIHVYNIVKDAAFEDSLGAYVQIKRRPATLEDVFFRLTGRSLIE